MDQPICGAFQGARHWRDRVEKEKKLKKLNFQKAERVIINLEENPIKSLAGTFTFYPV